MRNDSPHYFQTLPIWKSTLYLVMLLGAFSAFPSNAQENTSEIWEKHPDIPLLLDETEVAVLPWETYKDWIFFSFQLIPSQESSSLARSDICAHAHPLCDLESSEYSSFRRSVQRNISLSQEKIENFLIALQEKTRVEPEDARFELAENNRVKAFSPGYDGKEIDITENARLLTKHIAQIIEKPSQENTYSLSLATTPLPRDIRESQAQELGIHQLIAEGRSNFSGSSNDRLFNVRFGMEKYHGILIKPGEEFSFVEILGEVNEETGWRPELVIRNNRTEPEYGGGICQVSTTLFRAAIYAGLQITMRQNHSYPVKYYTPIGFDASVYVPRPDLRFINNTPGHILIQGNIEGNELIFRLYGTDDGRKVSMDGPHVIERGEGGTMKTVFTQTVTDNNGSVIIDKKFYSNYDNPDNYPKPEDIDLTEKPKDWSKKQWEEYKKEIEGYLKNR